MTKQEFAKIAMALQTFYPRENMFKTDQETELWYDMLEDIPYDVAQIGIKKWVATNKWPPSIAEIRSMAQTVTFGETKDWGKAWEEVINSIGAYGIYHVKEALEMFDDLTREAVERVGYRNICMSENIMTERANFRMIYEQLAERKTKNDQLSPKLRELIGNTQKALEG